MNTFNMKQWLMENKSGMYSKTMNEVDPATMGLDQDEADAEMQQQDDENGDMVDNASMDTVAEDTPNRMRFSSLQPDAEKYKIQTNLKGEIESATNEDGDTFVVGDKAVTADGETIEIKSLIGQQGKVKAIYYSGPTAYTYDIDGLEKIKEEQIGVGYVMKTKDSEGNIM
jgi:hypothetical protein